MKIDKENNQYYGQFIEEAINSIINQTEIKILQISSLPTKK